MEQFLPQLHDVLRKEGILQTSVFHVSDEPHTETDKANYRAARGCSESWRPG